MCKQRQIYPDGVSRCMCAATMQKINRASFPQQMETYFSRLKPLSPNVTWRQNESFESLKGTFLYPLYLGRPQILQIPLSGALWLLQIAGEINQAKTTTGV